jgi:predicted transcriptional regulator
MAQRQRTDRATLVNEAVAQYLEDQAGWTAHLADSLRQAEAGDFADEAAVAAAFRPRARPA